MSALNGKYQVLKRKQNMGLTLGMVWKWGDTVRTVGKLASLQITMCEEGGGEMETADQ